jgi:hypothetical protein
MLLNTSALGNRCEQLETALLAKAPLKSHLVYVTLYIELSHGKVEYRLSACLWKPGSRPDAAAFDSYTRGQDPDALLDKLASEIAIFELWTPAAIAATLGIEESV